MTTLANRPNTALLVVDAQNGVVEGAHERDAVVLNVGSLVERARHEDVPVVWVQHNDEGLVRGSDAWQIVPELVPGSAPASAGHRPHEPLLGQSVGARADGRDDRDGRRRLRRGALSDGTPGLSLSRRLGA